MAATRRARGDRGITLILVAAAMVAIVTIVAMVIDLSNVRNSRQDNKRSTDVAATAGAQELAPDGVPHPWAGVCAAFAYLKQNQPDLTLTPELPGRQRGPRGRRPLPRRAWSRSACRETQSTWAWIHAVGR